MRVGLVRLNAIHLALSIVAGLLVALLYWEWEQGQQLEKRLFLLRKVAPTSAHTVEVLPEFVLPSAETAFPELVARSMFVASRKSNAVGMRGGRIAMKKGQFVLVGVVVTPQQQSALLRDVQTNKTESVSINHVVRGMTLAEVAAAHVVLRLGSEFEELPLNVQTGPKGQPSVAQPQQPSASQSVAPPPMTIKLSSTPASAVPPQSAPPAVPSSVPAKPQEGASAPKPAPVAR